MPTVIVCPNCGFRFNKPLWSERQFGVGISFAFLGMGLLTCPKCKFKAGVRNFKKVTGPPSPEPPVGGESSASGGPKPEGDSESKGDNVDDSKYV
jgi:DNA-directed RNA polymerase subunit RPC12/RpoP